MTIITIALIIQSIILVVFEILSYRQRLRFKNNKDGIVYKEDMLFSNVDVIIAAKEDLFVIKRCLDSVSRFKFNRIFICLDNEDNSHMTEVLSKEYPEIVILANEKSLGKIKSQIKCIQQSGKDVILVLDADISLIDNEVEAFVNYYFEKNTDFLCPYSQGEYISVNNILMGIAETDRIMRQRIVRAGRDVFGVSNLSGYCLLANKQKYLDIIDTDAVQDDVIATINLFKKGFKVDTYHSVVCKEIERTSIKSYLLQKTRWTAGNIMLIKSYPKLFKTIGIVRALVFCSSFLLWYWALWIDFIAMVFAFFNSTICIYLGTEFIIKYVGVLLTHHSCFKMKLNYLIYVFVWPLLSFICLILSPYYLKGLIKDKETRR